MKKKKRDGDGAWAGKFIRIFEGELRSFAGKRRKKPYLSCIR